MNFKARNIRHTQFWQQTGPRGGEVLQSSEAIREAVCINRAKSPRAARKARSSSSINISTTHICDIRGRACLSRISLFTIQPSVKKTSGVLSRQRLGPYYNIFAFIICLVANRYLNGSIKKTRCKHFSNTDLATRYYCTDFTLK